MLLQRALRRRETQPPTPAIGELPLACSDSTASGHPQELRLAGVIFDPAGVLYDGTLWVRWLFQLLSRMGMYSHFTVFARVWEEDYLPLINLQQADYWQTMRWYLTSLGFTPAQLDEVQAAGQSRRREFEENARPLPHVRQTLEQLSRAGLSLSVCCSGPWTDEQMTARLERLQLADLFDGIDSRFSGPSSEPTQRDLVSALAETMAASELRAEETAVVSARIATLQAARSLGAAAIAVDAQNLIDEATMLATFDELSRLIVSNAACTRAG
ncbi:MAG: HAD hydrolase-like protein [Planctomycetales bacterium]|nr:HAD hydrolase-like protein [Planctomycetales bacterium]